MGNLYSGDHIAVDHIHMDRTTCITEEPRQMYRLNWNGQLLNNDLMTYATSRAT